MTVTINVAGTSSAIVARELLDVLMRKLIPYAGKEAEKQAYVKYDGTYTQDNSDSSLQITQPGPLTITEFRINGVDILNASAVMRGYRFYDIHPTWAILAPTDPDSLGTGIESWRYVMHIPLAKDFDTDSPDDRGFADIHCQDWMQLDKLRYGSEPLDVVKFVMKDGKAVAVELPAWRMTLEREL